jgi:thioredoxin 1
VKVVLEVFMDQLEDVTDKDFKEVVLEAKKPFLVDFWAPWSGPCRALGPSIEELSEEYAGRMGFAEVNVDNNPKTATEYGVRSVPTLLIFKDGKPIKQMVGLRPKAELKKQIDAILGEG